MRSMALLVVECLLQSISLSFLRIRVWEPAMHTLQAGGGKGCCP